MALTRDTWVTVLCRKLRDWWHWVADGYLIVGCRWGSTFCCFSWQEDIRNYIDNSLKHGVQLLAFRKERVGGDSHGISSWSGMLQILVFYWANFAFLWHNRGS